MEIVQNNMGDFQKVKFVVNEDCASDWVKAALDIQNPETDLINIFINKLIDQFGYREKIECKDLILHDIDRKYIHYFIAY